MTGPTFAGSVTLSMLRKNLTANLKLSPCGLVSSSVVDLIARAVNPVTRVVQLIARVVRGRLRYWLGYCSWLGTLTNAHDPARDGPQRQAGYEQAARHLDAEGEDGHHQLQHQRQGEQPKRAVDSLAGRRLLDGPACVREVAVVVAAMRVFPTLYFTQACVLLST